MAVVVGFLCGYAQGAVVETNVPAPLDKKEIAKKLCFRLRQMVLGIKKLCRETDKDCIIKFVIF